jgi:hypothetical protein
MAIIPASAVPTTTIFEIPILARAFFSIFYDSWGILSCQRFAVNAESGFVHLSKKGSKIF